jgi:hypothetical protein
MMASAEANVLKMIPKAFSREFSVMDGSQAVANVVDLSWWRRKGELTIQGGAYKVHRERAMSGAFVLESAAGVLARAEKPGVLRRCLVIEHSDRRYTLHAKSPLRRELLLFDDSKQIGSLSPEGVFTRRATADLPRVWPLPVRVFVIWLAVMLWKSSEG